MITIRDSYEFLSKHRSLTSLNWNPAETMLYSFMESLTFTLHLETFGDIQVVKLTVIDNTFKVVASRSYACPNVEYLNVFIRNFFNMVTDFRYHRIGEWA